MREYLRGLLTVFALGVVPMLGLFVTMMALFFAAYYLAKTFLCN